MRLIPLLGYEQKHARAALFIAACVSHEPIEEGRTDLIFGSRGDFFW